MSIPRIIPCLLIQGGKLVKTVRFAEPRYVGDPINAVRIFNEKEVDELVILDIDASSEGRGPQLDLIQGIASEAFMPVAYGGGVRSAQEARDVLRLGVEKIILNTSAMSNPGLVREISEECGAQSTLVCLDLERMPDGKVQALACRGKDRRTVKPSELARTFQELGAGEIIVQAVHRDGGMSGYDLDLVRDVASAVSIPVVAIGGAGSLEHLSQAIREGGASAAAAGSMFVFYGKFRAVMIQYPSRNKMEEAFRKEGQC